MVRREHQAGMHRMGKKKIVPLPTRQLGELTMLQKLCKVTGRSAVSAKQIVQSPDSCYRNSLKAVGGLMSSMAFLTSLLSALLIQSNWTRSWTTR